MKGAIKKWLINKLGGITWEQYWANVEIGTRKVAKCLVENNLVVHAIDGELKLEK